MNRIQMQMAEQVLLPFKKLHCQNGGFLRGATDKENSGLLCQCVRVGVGGPSSKQDKRIRNQRVAYDSPYGCIFQKEMKNVKLISPTDCPTNQELHILGPLDLKQGPNTLSMPCQFGTAQRHSSQHLE